jgi:hypothetical protein
MARLAGQKVGGFWDDTRNYIAKTRRLLPLPEKELQIITRGLERPWYPRLARAARSFKRFSPPLVKPRTVQVLSSNLRAINPAGLGVSSVKDFRCLEG